MQEVLNVETNELLLPRYPCIQIVETKLPNSILIYQNVKILPIRKKRKPKPTPISFVFIFRSVRLFHLSKKFILETKPKKLLPN